MEDGEDIPVSEVIHIDKIETLPEDDLVTIGQGSYGSVSIYSKNPKIVVKEHAQSSDNVTIDIYRKKLDDEMTKPEAERDLSIIAELEGFISAQGSVEDSCKIFKEQEYDKQMTAFSCFNSFLKSINSKIPRPITFKYGTRESRSIKLTTQGNTDTNSCVFFMEKLNYPSLRVLQTIIKPEIVERFTKTDTLKHAPPYLFFSDIGDDYENGKIKLTQMNTCVFKHDDKDLYASITDENVIQLACSMMSSFFGITFNCHLVLQDIEFLLTNKLVTEQRPCIGIIDYDQVQYFEKRIEMGNKLLGDKYSLSEDIAFIYMNLSGNSLGHAMQIDNKSVWKFLPDPIILPQIFLNQAMFMLRQNLTHAGANKSIIPPDDIQNYSEILKTILRTQNNTKNEKFQYLLRQISSEKFESIKQLLLNSWHNNFCIYCFSKDSGGDQKKFEKIITTYGFRFQEITELDLNMYRFFIQENLDIVMNNDEYIYYLINITTNSPLEFDLLDNFFTSYINRGEVFNFYYTSPNFTLLLFDILIQKLYLLIYFAKNNALITEDVIMDLTNNISDYTYEHLIDYFDHPPPPQASEPHAGGKKNKTKKSKKKTKTKKTKTKKTKTKTKKTKTKKTKTNIKRRNKTRK